MWINFIKGTAYQRIRDFLQSIWNALNLAGNVTGDALVKEKDDDVWVMFHVHHLGSVPSALVIHSTEKTHVEIDRFLVGCFVDPHKGTVRRILNLDELFHHLRSTEEQLIWRVAANKRDCKGVVFVMMVRMS